MSHSIEQLDFTTPAILARITSPVEPEAELRQMFVKLDGMLSAIKGRQVNLIFDFTDCELALRDLVLTLTSITKIREEVGAVNLFHPRVTPLFVEPGEMVRMIVDSYRRNNIHGPLARTFATLDDALAFARGQGNIRERREPRGLDGVTMPAAILRHDTPAPVVRYRLESTLVFHGNWEQMALDVVTMLAGIDSESAYVVIETPRLDMTAAEMTALLSTTSLPHGGSDISRGFQNRPNALTLGDNNLHIVITGLRYGQYGQEYHRMMKLITQAMEQIGQAWAIIRAIKGIFGSQLAGPSPVPNREN